MNYKEIKLLGEGSYGKVYLYEDETGKQVVAKILHKNASTKVTIINEHYVPLILQKGGCRRNISCMIDFIETEKLYIILSEYIEGVDMINWTIPEDKNILLNIANELADAFGYMHKKGVIHRDIKPANVIISNDYHPVVIDFGLSCIMNEVDVDKKSEQALCKNVNIRNGTPMYTAPELGEESGDIDLYATDIYSLGLLFFYMFNNKKEPIILTRMRTLWRDKRTKPYAKSSSGTEIDSLIDSMVSVDPKQRPKIEEVVAKISHILKTTNKIEIIKYEDVQQLMQDNMVEDYSKKISRKVNGKIQHLFEIITKDGAKYHSWLSYNESTDEIGSVD